MAISHDRWTFWTRGITGGRVARQVGAPGAVGGRCAVSRVLVGRRVPCVVLAHGARYARTTDRARREVCARPRVARRRASGVRLPDRYPGLDLRSRLTPVRLVAGNGYDKCLL